MGKFYKFTGYCLGLLCAAAFAFPAVASTLSVDVSPTTSYTVTNRTTTALPPRTTSGPITTYNPTFGPLAGGGAYQTTNSGITITAINGGTASTTMSGRINAGAAAMRNALTRCLTSFRCNAAFAAGAAGVQLLFDGIDALIDDAGNVTRMTPTYSDDLTGYRWVPDSGPATGVPFPSPSHACEATKSQYRPDLVSLIKGSDSKYYCTVSGPSYPEHTYGIDRAGSSCPDGFPYDSKLDACVIYSTAPFPPDELADAVDDSYIPDPSDFPYLTGGFDWSHPDVNFEITDIPSAVSDSSTFTQYPDGTSKSSETQFDFSWSNNPSKQPNVSVDETTSETTYSETGQATGTTTTITTSTGTGGGGGQPPSNEIEIPTDCDFMPTVCRFLEWFQEPDPETSQDIDFTQLIDTIDIEREFQVGSSTAACPAPFQISLAWVPSVEVSLQPFCDLADLLRPFLLSLCFLYSGMIILRT